MAVVADDGNVVDRSAGGRHGPACGHGSPGRKLPLGLAAGFLLLLGPGCDRAAPPDGEPQQDRASADTALDPAPARDTILEATLRGVVGEFDGEVGIAVLHLQKDVRSSLHGDRPFPLASIGKLPIAYAALQGGRAGPADSVAVIADDRAPGETPFRAGTSVPVASLVERSLAHSDNTASDVLLRLAGGPDSVTARTRALAVDGVRVDRSMRRIFAEWGGAPDPQDLRDTGTAEGIVALLAALHRGEALDAAARELLLESLRAADTGPNRIRAGVPAGTPVAHKTGTLGPLTHDVGIVALPAGRGDVAVAVLVGSDAALAPRERLIAAVARAVWDRFAS